jgi:hypothetical protein
MKQKLITLFLTILIMGFTSINGLTIPPTINYQGYLQTNEKIPVNDTLKLKFCLYATPSDNNVLWTEIHESVPIENGVFNVELGQTESFHSLIHHNNLYLGVTVGDDEEMSPRDNLSSVFSSFLAYLAETVKDGSITTEKLGDGAVTPEKVSDKIPVIKEDGNLSLNGGIVIDGPINIMEKLPENATPTDVAQIFAKPDRVAENSENSIVNKVLFYLKIDESDGTKLSDLAHKHEAIAYNDPSIVQGKTGYARQFDATKNQTILIKDHADFNFATNSFAIAFWMKAPAPDIWTVIMSKANCVINSKSCYGWFFGNLDGSSKSDLVFTINSGGTEDLNNKSVQASNIFDNNWHHIVGVKDGNSIYLHIDGQKRGTTANVSQSVSVDNDIVVGAIGDAYPYSGVIDEIIAWNRAISDTEIAELFSSDGLPIDEGGVFVRRKNEEISLNTGWRKGGKVVTLLKENVRVGIGIDNPGSQLDVAGPDGASVKFGTTSSSINAGTKNEGHSEIGSTWDDNFWIKTFDHTPNPNFTIGVGDGEGGWTHQPIMWNHMLIFNGSGKTWCPSCGTNVSDKNRADMVVAGNGYVGIGTVAPSVKFEVRGGKSKLEQEEWQVPSFVNGWANYDTNWNPAGYFKDSMGIVHLRGLVKNGSSTIFTLPVGYRPEYNELHAVSTDPNLYGRIDIYPNGNVNMIAGKNSWICLDGITFRAYR